MSEMTEEAVTALELSIEHWKQNVAAERPSEASCSGGDCALCLKFYAFDSVENERGNVEYFEECVRCPVYAATGGRQFCYGTPYYEARDALFEWKSDLEARDDWIIAAKAELDFRISLRNP